MVVETTSKAGNFTFRFSRNKEHYVKCPLFSCRKVGLLDQVHCVCNKIRYCSEACRDKDSTH